MTFSLNDKTDDRLIPASKTERNSCRQNLSSTSDIIIIIVVVVVVDDVSHTQNRPRHDDDDDDQSPCIHAFHKVPVLVHGAVRAAAAAVAVVVGVVGGARVG